MEPMSPAMRSSCVPERVHGQYGHLHTLSGARAISPLSLSLPSLLQEKNKQHIYIYIQFYAIHSKLSLLLDMTWPFKQMAFRSATCLVEIRPRVQD